MLRAIPRWERNSVRLAPSQMSWRKQFISEHNPGESEDCSWHNTTPTAQCQNLAQTFSRVLTHDPLAQPHSRPDHYTRPSDLINDMSTYLLSLHWCSQFDCNQNNWERQSRDHLDTACSLPLLGGTVRQDLTQTELSSSLTDYLTELQSSNLCEILHCYPPRPLQSNTYHLLRSAGFRTWPLLIKVLIPFTVMDLLVSPCRVTTVADWSIFSFWSLAHDCELSCGYLGIYFFRLIIPLLYVCLDEDLKTW